MEKINPYELIEKLCLLVDQPRSVLSAASELGYYWMCREKIDAERCLWFNKRQDEACKRTGCKGVRPLELATPAVRKHVRWYNGTTLCGHLQSGFLEEEMVTFEKYETSTCEVCVCRAVDYKKG